MIKQIRKIIRNQEKMNQQGFTIIELTIATIIFALIMILLVFGVIQITREYYKGVTESSTENTARTALNLISQSLQFGDASYRQLAAAGDGTQGICIGSQLFSYARGYELVTGAPNTAQDQTSHAFVVNTPTDDCGNPPGPQQLISGNFASGSRELLSPNMRVVDFEITPIYSPPTQAYDYTVEYEVHLRIASGDNVLLCSPSRHDCQNNTDNFTTGLSAYDLPANTIPKDLTCKGQATTEEFCAVSDLTTTVENRL